MGQVIGNPPVTHYSHQDFNSDGQFWDACQDTSGIMYFGNNYGVLRFDGERWNKISLPNNSAVRSLHCSENGIVYAGGYNEFGIIETNTNGSFTYQSLRNILPPKYSEIGNVWQILELNNTIILRTFDFLILLNRNNVEIIEASGTFNFAGISGNDLLVLDKKNLFLLNVNTSQFQRIISTEDILNESILKILPGHENESLYLLTKEGSLFEISLKNKTAHRQQKLISLSSKQVFTSAIQSLSGEVYIGTLSNKLSSWKFQDNRLIKVRSFGDLQDQTVLNIFESHEGIIWILLNKGLDFFDPNAHLTNIFQGSSIYDAILFNNRLFIATNQGVFHSADIYSNSVIYQNEFQKIPMLDGQTWSLKVIDNQLFCAHDQGLFMISNGQTTQIPGFQGVWKLFPVSGKSDQFFICHYNGIGLIQIRNGNYLVLSNSLPGFDDSTRDLIDIPGESDSYWVCHGYKGVFKIKTNKENSRVVSTEHFNEQNGLPSPFNINVHRWNGQNIFTTNDGLFIFDKTSETFVPHEALTKLLGSEKNIRQLVQQGDTTWCVIDDQLAFFDKAMKNVITNPFLSLKGTLNRGMECIVPLKNANEVLLGTTNGLYAFHPEAKSQLLSAKVKTRVSRISYSINDSITTFAITDTMDLMEFPNNVHNISFWFSAPYVRDKANIRYSYLLKDQMKEWSEWQEEPMVNFSFLKGGDYLLKVKAQSLSGEVAQITQIPFTIAPAWFATWPWLIFWGLITTGMVLAGIRQIQVIIVKEKEKTRVEEQQLQEVRDMERENQLIIQEKKRVEADIIKKSKDLANNAVLIAKKRELLIDIQERLNELRKNAKNDYTRTGILNIVRSIEINLNDEQQYLLFDTNLERVHQELFDELKSRHPNITTKDLRMCAFIKMELTNKEMASIFNISVRGVETARYRLRKKFPDIYELIGQV
ncbi:hypothetical protein [Marinilabilia sp.]|uniref:hypothetical protein n=1 Tax=Marinilabilia sp. TaxID=2021252 RepID=UPI0025C5DD65|nr:hypothetical protein [Marinilabilia sp.]